MTYSTEEKDFISVWNVTASVDERDNMMMGIQKFINENSEKEFYILGNNDRTIPMIRYLEQKDMDVKGILCSQEKYKTKNKINGFPLYVLSEIKKDAAVIVVLRQSHLNEIFPQLIKSGIQSIYYLTLKDILFFEEKSVFYEDSGDLDDMYPDQAETLYTSETVWNLFKKKGVKVESVIEFGCGAGTFLHNAKRVFGAKVLGLDGNHAERSKYLSMDEFIICDLTKDNISDLFGEKKFDLCVSVETAEHLPADTADSFVRSMCKMADTIVFAAAVRYQHGDGHINEQRLSYWQEKFLKYGFEIIDCIRPIIWDDVKIPVWYRQNMVVFTKDSKIKTMLHTNYEIHDIIHPDLFEGLSASYISGQY